MKYIKPHEMKDYKFDACVSISSYEHDGLGRYGDPLNPDGDLEEAMKELEELFEKMDSFIYLCQQAAGKVVFQCTQSVWKTQVSSANK